MSLEYIIMDSSVKRINARNVLMEGVFFTGYEGEQETWTSTFVNAKKYSTVEEAVQLAKKLALAIPEKPPRIFTLNKSENGINITEIKYT